AVAPPLHRACVVRVLRRALERRAEGLLDGAVGVAEGAGQLADHGVGDHHGRELAARQHVGADRDHVRRQVLEHPVVEALVAPAEQGQVQAAAGELGGEGVIELPSPGGQRDHPPCAPDVLRVAAVALPQGRLHHIHPDDHPGAASVRRVVDLAGGERRGGAQVDRLEAQSALGGAPDVPLLGEPVEPGREEGQDVDVHSGPASSSLPAAPSSPRKRRSTSIRRASTSTRRTASDTSGTRTPPSPTSSRSHEGAATTPVTAPSPGTSQPSSSSTSHSPARRSSASRSAAASSASPRSASAAARLSTPETLTSGRASVPARLTTVSERPDTATGDPSPRSSVTAPST